MLLWFWAPCDNNGAINWFFFCLARTIFFDNFCYSITEVERTLWLRIMAKASARSKKYASLSKGVFLWREEKEVFRSILHTLLPCLQRLLLNWYHSGIVWIIPHSAQVSGQSCSRPLSQRSKGSGFAQAVTDSLVANGLRWLTRAKVNETLYEKFTDPTPHSFLTFSSTTKLGLGLPNKAMNTCE